MLAKIIFTNLLRRNDHILWNANMARIIPSGNGFEIYTAGDRTRKFYIENETEGIELNGKTYLLKDINANEINTIIYNNDIEKAIDNL